MPSDKPQQSASPALSAASVPEHQLSPRGLPLTLTRGQRGWILVALAACFVGLAAYSTWRAVKADPSSDYWCFHMACAHWWRTGEYTQEFGLAHYPPAFMVLASPLFILPPMVGVSVFMAINIAALIYCLRFCDRYARALLPAHAVTTLQHIDPWLRWLLLFALVSPYAITTLMLGQVNILMLAGTLLAFDLWRRGHGAAAGAIIAVAALTKMLPAIFGVYWLARRDWRPAAAALLVFITLNVAGSLGGLGLEPSIDAHQQWIYQLRGGPPPNVPDTVNVREWMRTTSPQGHVAFVEQRNRFHRKNNQSLAAVLRRVTTDLFPAAVTDQKVAAQKRDMAVNLLTLPPRIAGWLFVMLATGTLAVLLIVAHRHRHRQPSFAEWAGWLALTIVLVPVYWTHYFVILLPALAVVSGWAVSAWSSHQAVQKSRLSPAVVVLGVWVASLPLLAWDAARLLGLQCVAAILVGVFVLVTRRLQPSLPVASSGRQSAER